MKNVHGFGLVCHYVTEQRFNWFINDLQLFTGFCSPSVPPSLTRTHNLFEKEEKRRKGSSSLLWMAASFAAIHQSSIPFHLCIHACVSTSTARNKNTSDGLISPSALLKSMLLFIFSDTVSLTPWWVFAVCRKRLPCKLVNNKFRSGLMLMSCKITYLVSNKLRHLMFYYYPAFSGANMTQSVPFHDEQYLL